MSRKIIIQERINEPSDFSFRYVFWADVPSTRQSFYADAAKTSVVKDASGSELSAIQTGAILERQDNAFYKAGTAVAVIKADMILKFNEYQAEVTARNPFQFYGTFWDGSAWTNGGAL